MTPDQSLWPPNVKAVKRHNIHLKPKFYKLEFLKELIVYHGIKT